MKRHLAHNHPELSLTTKPATAESAGDCNAPGSAQDDSNQGSSPNETTLPQLGIPSQSSHFESEAPQGDQELGRLADLEGDIVSGHQMQGNSLDHFDFESLLRDMNGGQLLLHTPSALAGVLGDDPNTGLHFAFDSPILSQPPQIALIEPNESFANDTVPAVASKPDILETDPAQFIYILKPDGGFSLFSISESKRDLIVKDTEAVFSLARVPDTFRVPSCMAMERYITDFFDTLLVHAPCIHVPTFRTEHAQPSLILAIAALGAQYHEEKDMAVQLHRAARLSILNQMEKTSFTSKGRPTWILQSLFFTMAFGVWQSDFDAVQESLAFQSNLGHIVRYVSYPGARWVDDTHDISL